MPALLLLVVLLVPLLAGCVPGGARGDGVPTADAPFTLIVLDVVQSTFPFRGMRGGSGSPSSAAVGTSPIQ